MSIAARRDLLERGRRGQGPLALAGRAPPAVPQQGGRGLDGPAGDHRDLALLAPLLSPHPYDEVYWERIAAPPDFANAHWFGTDGNGRDLFVRTLYGARVSR